VGTIAVGDARTIKGHATGGNDTLQGSGFVATLYGAARSMTGHGRGGDDLFHSTARSAKVVGDAERMDHHATGGNDTIGGGALGSSSSLYGDAVTMSGHAKGGNDTITFTGGNFTQAYGDAETLSGHSRGGNDSITVSNTGNPASLTAILYGDGSLSGKARGGDDILISGAGVPDLMWGDGETVGPDATTGSDRFVFTPGNGADVIGDFERAKDDIDLTAFATAGIHGLDDLVFTQADTGTMIDFGDGNSVTLLGVTALCEKDFLFTCLAPDRAAKYGVASPSGALKPACTDVRNFFENGSAVLAASGAHDDAMDLGLLRSGSQTAEAAAASEAPSVAATAAAIDDHDATPDAAHHITPLEHIGVSQFDMAYGHA
jgi:serralysin